MRRTGAVVEEAKLREAEGVHDLIHFVPLRRENVELPDAIFDNPILQSVWTYPCNFLDDELDRKPIENKTSYHTTYVEQAIDHTSNNIVTVDSLSEG
ncbi:hypothetical protein EDB19DRAFT_1173075 [Suillus lakei]|nr:hypothetical protein EDB19DRAFT_1173075 [Suillus lakei]